MLLLLDSLHSRTILQWIFRIIRDLPRRTYCRQMFLRGELEATVHEATVCVCQWRDSCLRRQCSDPDPVTLPASSWRVCDYEHFQYLLFKHLKKNTTNLQMEVTICPVDFCYFEKIFHEENEFNRELNNVVVRQPSGLTFSFVPVHVAVPDSR